MQVVKIKAQVNSISSVVDVDSAWRADGNGVTTAIYESQSAAEAAASQVQVIWGSLAGLLAGAPSTETYDNVERMKS